MIFASVALAAAGAPAALAADVCWMAPSRPITAHLDQQGEGALLDEALAAAHERLGVALSWPPRSPLPESITSLGNPVSTCAVKGGARVRVSLAFDPKAIAEVLARLAAREHALLEGLSKLASRAAVDAPVRLSSLVSLQGHMRAPGRIALPRLLEACRAVGGCSEFTSEAEALATATLEAGRNELEFMFSPQDDVAKALLGEVDAGLGARGLRVRDTSVTNLTRQLKTRCQRVLLPGIEGQNLRVVELACEAEALVRGVKVATMRFVGRGQDMTPDDAHLDARRRFALDDFRFSGGK